MRDHRKLRAFGSAHRLAISVYRVTREFPARETYGMAAQPRRAAVSVPSNIVEGSARDSLVEYIRFVEIAYGSAVELEYQLELSRELGLIADGTQEDITLAARDTARALNRLLRRLRDRLSPGSLRPEAPGPRP